MKSLLFVIAAAPLLVSPALARGDSPAASVQNRTCKWCGSDPSYYGTQAQPRAAVICRSIREQVETPKGHLVYRTHRICT
jgi:hypothetical protein